jgi:hypothetical protein
MERRVVLTVVLVVVMSLSGCSALPIWDGGDASPESGTATSSPTPTPTPDVPEANPEGEPGDGPDVAYPDGYGPNGVEAADTAISNHIGTLQSYDNYIFSYDSLIQADDSQTSFSYQQLVDQENEVAYIIQDTSQGAIVSYYEDQTVYIRDETGDETRYNSTDTQYNMGDFTGFQFVGPLLAHVEYGDAEVLESDSGTIYRYVSENVTNPDAILRSDVDESRIDAFNVSIVVDEDGAVRQAVFVVKADRDITVTMGVSEINSTNIDRPEWYEQAANS